MKFEFYRQRFEKYSNIKFNENSSNFSLKPRLQCSNIVQWELCASDTENENTSHFGNHTIFLYLYQQSLRYSQQLDNYGMIQFHVMAILSISIMWIKIGGQREMSIAWNKNDRCQRSKYETDKSELKPFYSNKNSEFKNYNFIFCKVWVLLGERKEPCCYSLYEWHSISF